MGKIRAFWHNLSLKKAFILIITVFLLAAILAISYLSELGWSLQDTIRSQYVVGEDTIVYHYDEEGRSLGFSYSSAVPEESITPMDRFLLNTVCEFLIFWSLPVVSAAGIILAAYVFYRLKLKIPIEQLTKASAYITMNNLDYTVDYQGEDEMGRLCASFEIMRSSLAATNREMWRVMEERRRVSAAFSHDLRTPLTVLKGYTDMLLKYLPENKITQEKLLTTLSMTSAQVERLVQYVSTMNAMQKLSDGPAELVTVRCDELALHMRESAQILCAAHTLRFESTFDRENMELDQKIVLQVYDNLLSNAARFAQSEVWVTLSGLEGRFRLIVRDDGKGFSAECLAEATNAFYKGEESDVHFGMGLYICQVLTEKHGGSLQLSNRPEGGARVQADFLIL